jgi:hypothetical protein
MRHSTNRIGAPTGVYFARRSKTAQPAGHFLFKTLSLLANTVLVCDGTAAFAQDGAANPLLRIDTPTKLEKANVAIDFSHAVFNGDMPFAPGDINLLAHDKECP